MCAEASQASASLLGTLWKRRTTYYLALCLLVVAGLRWPGGAWADHVLKPGDTLDRMVLQAGKFDPNIPPIDAFCQPPINREKRQPGSYPVTCTVQAVPILDIGPGWLARPQPILD